MQRAAVLIGVSQSGKLPQLQAVDAGVTSMRNWALEQGVAGDHIAVLTDTGGREVLAHDVYTAVERLVAKATIEQLLIYYAGHGVNNGYSEYWLLSHAPTNANEAINVAGSIVLAERSGIPHIVIVSDTCRTRPDSIAAQSVTGSQMFPNQPPAGPSASVDVFYACLLGDPANEFRDPNDASAIFQSLYTEVLVEALQCRHPELVDTVSEGGARYNLVRPWPLKRQLPSLVLARIKAKNLWRLLSQTPDAKVTSDPDRAWITRRTATGRRRDGRRRRAEPPSLRSLVASEIHRAIDPDRKLEPAELTPPVVGRVEGREEFTNATVALVAEFGPLHYESGAGFKLRGERVVEAHGAGVEAEVLADDLVRMLGIDKRTPGASVLMRFSSGACAVLPAVFQYMCAITVEDGRLVDVSYEPMDTHPRWEEFRQRAGEIRRGRAAVGAASRMGMVSLEADTVLAMARYLQGLKGLDPSFALYAAYAYHDLGRRDLIAEMRDYLFSDLGITFFDLDLLLGRTPRIRVGDGPPITLPFFPMLSQGWSLTRAYGIDLPPEVADPASRVPSLWAMFTPDTYDRMRAAIAQGEVR